MKIKYLITIVLFACSERQTPSQAPHSPTQKESVTSDFFQYKPLLQEPRYIGGDSEIEFKEVLPEDFWQIPMSAFQCRGSKLNSPRREKDKVIEDCLGKHTSFPKIAQPIVDFLERFQKKSEKRLTILIGWRCDEHERYIEAKDSFQKGDQVVVRLEGVTREELKRQFLDELSTKEPIEVLENGFSIEDKDLWGESQTLLVRLKKRDLRSKTTIFVSN
ncbi:MAG: hypothetical protein FJZ62_03235 [Chlamydiae bacterium]|nr:hypothetical protein [Chlamydiota bacterium]